MSSVNVTVKSSIANDGNRRSRSWIQKKFDKLEKWWLELSRNQAATMEATQQLGEDQQRARSEVLNITYALNDKISESRLEFERQILSLQKEAERREDEKISTKIDELRADMEGWKKVVQDLSDKVGALDQNMESLEGDVNDMKQKTEQEKQKLQALTRSMNSFKKEGVKLKNAYDTQMDTLHKDVESMKMNRCRIEVLDFIATVLYGMLIAKEDFNKSLSGKLTNNQKELLMELKIKVRSRPDEFDFVKNKLGQLKKIPTVDDVKNSIMEEASTHPMIGTMIDHRSISYK